MYVSMGGRDCGGSVLDIETLRGVERSRESG